MSTANDNVKNILESLKTYYDNSSIPVYIPTIQKESLFKILTIKEHRQLYNTISNKSDTDSIANAFNNLILDAHTEHDQLTVLDRPIILLCLRMHLFGDTLNVKDSSDNKATVNISKHIKKCIDMTIPPEVYSCNVKDGDFEIACQIPDLKSDTNTNIALFNKLKTEKEKTLGHLFIYELIKHIKSLTFNGHAIEFKDISIDQQIQICELFPISVSNDILKYVSLVNEFEERYLKVSNKVTLVLDSILLGDETD
jgi:hypothetical protein